MDVDPEEREPFEKRHADITLMRSGTSDHGAQVGEWTAHERPGAPSTVTNMG